MIKFISPKKAVNSAFLKLPVSVENMEQFKLSLVNLYKKHDLTKDEDKSWETPDVECYLIGAFPALQLNIDDYPGIWKISEL